MLDQEEIMEIFLNDYEDKIYEEIDKFISNNPSDFYREGDLYDGYLTDLAKVVEYDIRKTAVLTINLKTTIIIYVKAKILIQDSFLEELDHYTSECYLLEFTQKDEGQEFELTYINIYYGLIEGGEYSQISVQKNVH